MNDSNEPRQILTGHNLESRMIEIEKGQQLGGHYPDADALGRARRILTGEITEEEALAEIEAKWGFEPS